MTRRLIDVTVAALFGGGLVLTCSSCSTLQNREAAAAAPPPAPLVTRWEQVSFGKDARFAVCIEPACPRVTPKTLAQAPAPVAAAEPGDASVPLRAVALRPAEVPTQRTVSAAPDVPRPVIEARNVIINFPLGSAELTSEGRTRIRESLEAAKQSERIVISGRTDALGGDKVNESLALARAIAVRNYFRDLAPDLPATFAIDAKGRCCFVASNDDEPGRSRNRRVEVHFSTQGGA
ncbi:MAG: OmpA family protein [Rhodocyclales bacterium]|nr:OmpA family protein [Rhodocyclales bacterium]